PTPHAHNYMVQLHPLKRPSLTTHAYAYIPTHMRETLIHWPQTNTPRTQLHRPTPYALQRDSQMTPPRICVVWCDSTMHIRGKLTQATSQSHA
ncbi:hypothetical protein PIB30_058081, partial [Stylosanthes scabra]|nr:hypothetical protein [Stylosanthes scabra]